MFDMTGLLAMDQLTFHGYGVSLPAVLFAGIVILPLLYYLLRTDTWTKRFVLFVRVLLVAALVVAAAKPFVSATQNLSETPQLVYLNDRSRSMDLVQEFDPDFESIAVNERSIAAGNNSDLQNGILGNLREDTTYLISSDFRSSSSLQGLAQRFREKNSTLNAVRLPMEEEYAVTVDGPDSTVPGASNRFTVTVSGDEGELPVPRVLLDGQAVSLHQVRDTEGVWRFSREFDTQGSHRIEARIDVGDRFADNNRFFKTVSVKEKPEILVVGEEGSLRQTLEEFYDVTHRSSIPEDLSDYYAVILKEAVSSPELYSYVVEGNGLVFTGDVSRDDAFDLLPVRPVEIGDESKGSKIVLAIDISESIRETEGATQLQKQLAYNLVEMLPFNNRVGAVAYNRDVYSVAEPESLVTGRDTLLDRIARLQPSGPSFHHNGLRGAAEMLNGTGNIIWVTDGKFTPSGRFHDIISEETPEAARELDVRLIAVAVGDADTDFLRSIANQAGGMFLNAEEAGRLNFVFNAGGAAGNVESLVVIDPDHFITDGMDPLSRVTLFDQVEPRRGADLLLTSVSGKPVLTAWNYGIGRVAAFSASGPDVSMITDSDPSVVTRTVSWAVGDPSRKEEQWLEVESGRWGDLVTARANYPVEGLKRQASDRYAATIQVESLGFHSFQELSYAYNYDEEVESVGYSDGMEDIVRQTGGEVYSPGEMEGLAESVQGFSERQVVKQQSITTYFLLAALLLFVLEIGIRKLGGLK